MSAFIYIAPQRQLTNVLYTTSLKKNIRNGKKNIADTANARCPLCCNLYLGTTKSFIYFFVPDRRALEGLLRTNKLERKEGAVLFKHL